MHNPGEVSDAAQVLEQDPECRNLIQSSPNLAYVCLMIRSGRHELASHAIQTLQGDKDGPTRQIALYLQSQIDIETHVYGSVKARLVAHLEENPGDIVALSLLQAAIHAELSQDPPVSVPAAKQEAATPISHASPVSLPEPKVPVEPAGDAGKSHFEARSSRYGRDARASVDVDLMPFQSVLQDPGNRAFVLWEDMNGNSRKEVREEQADAAVSELPKVLPIALDGAISGLEGGRILKTCFSFARMTATTLHHGNFHCGLITGPLNQSLITIVRTETLFNKRSTQLAAQGGERDGAS